MIHDAAKKLNVVITADDLRLLQDVFRKVCELRDQEPNSPRAEESAKILINLFQSGIRNRHQLVAMMTGRKFP